uniref:Uncharacterized protein MANES_18G051200 n=1 Tax=Rhizophora mucronata TaxID=61149 RepID=A0A2P2JL99_RHIMU
MANITSDTELKMNKVIKDHLNAFCPAKTNRFSSKSSAFFQGKSFTEPGMASHSLSFATFICNLILLGSPNWAIDIFMVHAGEKLGLACTGKYLCIFPGGSFIGLI